ncbi:DUF2312 domain-containing protein [Sphingobium yanoikuyae]|uniref:DUF2312 domain-containing protein n=1 Tax=Sphingobium yanoikuyae TaxID=13690 RepID=UPI00406CD459
MPLRQLRSGIRHSRLACVLDRRQRPSRRLLWRPARFRRPLSLLHHQFLKGMTMSGTNVAAENLRQGIERIERLEAEKQALADDIKDVYAEYKAQGFDSKMMREVIRLRKMPPHDRQEMQSILETYLAALGME